MEPRCKEKVDVRDTYRLVRGRGFQMHYTHRDCRRKPQENGFCWQHQPERKTIAAILERNRMRSERYK